jgi:spore coat protein U-like protein
LRNRTTKFAAIAVFGLLAVGFAFASSTATSTMTVSATISANCTISANPLAFGVYDPVVTNASTALTGSTTLGVNCTNGALTTVTLGQGSYPDVGGGSTDASPLRRMKSGSNYLSYSLTQDSGGNTTWGNTSGTGEGYTGIGTADSLTVYGSVAAGQNEPAGTYSDSVVATITF